MPDATLSAFFLLSSAMLAAASSSCVAISDASCRTLCPNEMCVTPACECQQQQQGVHLVGIGFCRRENCQGCANQAFQTQISCELSLEDCDTNCALIPGCQGYAFADDVSFFSDLPDEECGDKYLGRCVVYTAPTDTVGGTSGAPATNYKCYAVTPTGALQCGPVYPSAATATDSWCEDNCKHNPPMCPIKMCYCQAGVTPTPPKPEQPTPRPTPHRSQPEPTPAQVQPASSDLYPSSTSRDVIVWATLLLLAASFVCGGVLLLYQRMRPTLHISVQNPYTEFA